MSKVRIDCPSCKKFSKIEVSFDAIKDARRGVLAVNISADIICQHSFIAYIDKELNVRDYFISDFKIELPEISSIEKVRREKVPKRAVVDIDLIKLNIPAMQLTYILKSIFSKQKIVIVLDYEFLYDHILNFFKYITQGSFETDILIRTNEIYKKEKKKYKKSMVFQSYKILNNVKKTINPKNLAIEKQIVNRFFTQHESEYSYILLKNEIQKAYELSKKIVEFIKDCKEKNENVNILKIRLQVEKIYLIKISRLYLIFLINIAKNYYKVVVPSYSESFINSF